jgi:hydroxymethylpyrimidine pyrophosphatase-like HAD family hydrolase
MRYLVLCTDYDGTLATDGRVFPETVAALERLLASGRRMVLVTGRELDDLKKVCPRLDLFEYVVAENGALLYHPATNQETPLAPRPPDAFVALLRQRGVGPISVGRVIVATWEPHETTVLATIRDLGLELQVIFNKGAVMILPAGVNKATGLAHALEQMELSPRNAVGVGDAENDHALLALCECSVAVANALPSLKGAADIVTQADHGAGVVELIDELLRDDLASREPQLTRHHVLLGTNEKGREVRVRPYEETVLVVGPTHSGKSELATSLLERLALKGYTHWVVVDHTQPQPSGDGQSVVHIAERPERVARQVLRATSLFIAFGTAAPALLDEFCQVSGRARPSETPVTVEDGVAGRSVPWALAWRPAEPNAQPFRLNTAMPQHPPSGGGGGVVKAATQRPANTSTRGLH